MGTFNERISNAIYIIIDMIKCTIISVEKALHQHAIINIKCVFRSAIALRPSRIDRTWSGYIKTVNRLLSSILSLYFTMQLYCGLRTRLANIFDGIWDNEQFIIMI